jgi:hypothetical protein
MNSQAAAKERPEIIEPIEDGCIELSDEELLALIDKQAQESLHISGKEFLRRYRDRNPVVNAIGQPVPAWKPLADLAWLLDD